MAKYYNPKTKKFEEKSNDKKMVTGKGKFFGLSNNTKVNKTMSELKKKTGKSEADLKKMSASELKRASSKSYMPTPSTSSKSTMSSKGENKYNVGVSKGGVSFNEAFAYHKKQGKKTFTWNGNKFTTETKK